MKNRALSVHQEHELLMKLEQAGLDETAAQAVIESKGNALASKVVKLISGGVRIEGDWFPFTTTTATLKELRDQNPELFHPGSRWWFHRSFARNRGKADRQLQIRITPVPRSYGKTSAEQQKLLSDGEFVLTARDLVEGAIAYHQATGKWPSSPEYMVRTQEGISTFGRGVYVGFPWGVVYVDDYWVHRQCLDSGLAVGRES